MNLPSKAVVAAAAFSVLGASAVGSVFNATPARAAGITFVQGTAISTGTKVVSVPMTLSSAIGSGDLLVGWFSEYNASGQVTVSDSVNGAWTRGPSALTYAGAGDIALYYLADSTGRFRSDYHASPRRRRRTSGARWPSIPEWP